MAGSYVQPDGADQELLVALRTLTGEAWGVLSLYREPGQPAFDADALEFLNSVSTCLAEGAQRGPARRRSHGSGPPGPSGLVVLNDQWTEGRWIVLHAASLVADGARRVAVIVEPADPARILPLLMAAYGLT